MPAGELPGKQSLLIFEVAGHACALAAARIPELLLLPALVKSPAQPAVLDGFMNLRGAAVPVLPMHRLFGLPAPEPALHTPLIVTRSGQRLVAFRVDRVEDVAVAPPAAIEPYTRDDSINECAEGQISIGGRDVVLLSLDRLLAARERRCLEEYQDEMQRRLAEFEVRR